MSKKFFFSEREKGKETLFLNDEENKRFVMFDEDAIKNYGKPIPYDKLNQNDPSSLIGHNFNKRELFDIYNLTPEKHEGHKFHEDWYGPPPRFEDGSFKFKTRDGTKGSVPLKKGTLLNGVPLDKVDTIETDVFEISYTVSYPNRGPFPKKMMILLHGVPTQKNQKYEVMRHLGKFMFCVAPDMLGMGESDKPKFDDLSKWDWHNDIDWVDRLISHLRNEYPFLGDVEPIFEADDWGGGIALHYAAASGAGKFEMNGIEFPLKNKISQLIMVNPIALDGYYVREIGSIGRLSGLPPKDFMMAVGGFDQTVVQIEKQMIYDRSKMNNYTERDFLSPYCDVNYQSGKMASEQGVNFWNISILADRSSRLAPRQLQPYKDGKGVKYEDIKVSSILIWGMKDQMMPPTQMDRLYYLLTLNHQRCYIHEIEKADHFSEWDRPDAISRAIIRSIRCEFGPNSLPIFLGNDSNAVYKGDERVMIERLAEILF